MQNNTITPKSDLIERHCAKCGDKFSTRHKNQFYCSVPCKRAGSSQSHTLASALSVFAAPVVTPGLLGLEERINRLDLEQIRAMQRMTFRLLDTNRTAAQQRTLHGRRG